MKEWYSAKGLSGLPGMPGTERNCRKKLDREMARFREATSPGGPGGKRREYHLSSLPEETRVAILAQAAGIIPETIDSRESIVSFLASRAISLSPAELADPRIQAKITCTRAYEACPAYGGREVLLDSLAANYGKSKPQIRRWITSIQTLRTRSHTPRITLSGERVEIPESSAFSPEALAFGISSYANNFHAGIKTAYRALQKEAERQRNLDSGFRRNDGQGGRNDGGEGREGWRTGDYTSFIRILRRIPEPVWLRINKGATGFELHGLPKIIRQWTAVPVQSVLCGDQKIFDYLTYDPETDDIISPEGYLWMDCSSRMIVGAWIELSHYNQYTVGNSLREALRYGIPDEIFTDWGKAEGAKHINHILQSLSGFSTTGDFNAMEEKYSAFNGDDSPEHRKAQPGKPWMKPIENIMNIVQKRLLDKQIPGYRKRDTADPWRNKEQQDLLKKQARKGQLMMIQDFITTVFSVIDEHNRAEKQLKEGGSIVPLDFFARGLHAAPKPVFDDRTLDYICLPTFERQPHQAVISLTMRTNDHRTYYSQFLSGRRARVRISVDPYDRDAPATLSNLDGKFLGLADAWHAQDPRDGEGLGRKLARQKELMRWVREQANRVREGFGLADATPVSKIAPVTATARDAHNEMKVYQLRKVEEKEEQKRIQEDAFREQQALAVEFAAHHEASKEIDPWRLSEGREKYAYWRILKLKIDRDEMVTAKQADFYARYPGTADYRACNSLYEQWGEIYIGGVTNG